MHSEWFTLNLHSHLFTLNLSSHYLSKEHRSIQFLISDRGEKTCLFIYCNNMFYVKALGQTKLAVMHKRQRMWRIGWDYSKHKTGSRSHDCTTYLPNVNIVLCCAFPSPPHVRVSPSQTLFCTRCILYILLEFHRIHSSYPTRHIIPVPLHCNIYSCG